VRLLLNFSMATAIAIASLRPPLSRKDPVLFRDSQKERKKNEEEPAWYLFHHYSHIVIVIIVIIIIRARRIFCRIFSHTQKTNAAAVFASSVHDETKNASIKKKLRIPSLLSVRLGCNSVALACTIDNDPNDARIVNGTVTCNECFEETIEDCDEVNCIFNNACNGATIKRAGTVNCQSDFACVGATIVDCSIVNCQGGRAVLVTMQIFPAQVATPTTFFYHGGLACGTSLKKYRCG